MKNTVINVQRVGYGDSDMRRSIKGWEKRYRCEVEVDTLTYERYRCPETIKQAKEWLI